MDKRPKRVTSGRLSIAVALAVCLIMVAVPSFAFAAATNGSSYPAGAIAGQPGQIGTQVTSSKALVSGVISINGAPVRSFLTNYGTMKGKWVPLYGGAPDYTVSWSWQAGTTGNDSATLYCYPPANLPVGTYNITAVATDASGTVSTLTGWAFNVTGVYTPPSGGGTSTGATAGCAQGCHLDPVTGKSIAWSGTPGMGTNCAACHTGLDLPPHGFPGYAGPDPHSAIFTEMASNLNAECVDCHGTNFLAVASASSGITGIDEHDGCSCHEHYTQAQIDAKLAAAPTKAGCLSCHAQYGAHLFNPAVAPWNPTGWKAASGHNTDQFGIIGAKTKFDGTQGVTLTWKAVEDFTVTSIKAAAAMDPAFPAGTVVASGTTGVVNTNWNFPSKSVFWPATDDPNSLPAPANAKKGLTSSDSVVCADCHAGLTSAMGPHGATWAAVGMYPGFTAPYEFAGLTKKITSGETSAWKSASGIMKVDLTAAGEGVANQAARKAAWAVQANWTSGDDVICARCHKLETNMLADPSVVGTTNASAWGSTPGTSGRPWNVVVGASTPHNSHHQDATDGSNQCVSCHVAIPHGWKAPRLLVDFSVAANEEEGIASGWNTEDLMTLAGLNQHPVVPADGTIAYSTGDGSSVAGKGLGTETDVSRAGTVLWDESQCDACGDHYGADQKFHSGANDNVMTSDPNPGQETKFDAAIPARIQQH